MSSRLPLAGEFRITCEFGKESKRWKAGFHTGVDMVNSDKIIYSPTFGKVFRIGFDASYGNYVGGFCGRLGTDSNARSGAANNITIIGTPTYDSNGVIIDSTTKITSTNGSYVGGVTGINYHKSGETYATSELEINANGIYVQGYAQIIGGIFGYNYTDVSHLTISNSLIIHLLPFY